MTTVAGIDYSSRAVDIVHIDVDGDSVPVWDHFPLEGSDAFDRAGRVAEALPGAHSAYWDDTLAIGIEDPRGRNSGALYRVQGAILACLPPDTLVHPWIPSQWRKAVGLAGNASKDAIGVFAGRSRGDVKGHWPQDACDAYCIALATAQALERTEAAA